MQSSSVTAPRISSPGTASSHPNPPRRVAPGLPQLTTTVPRQYVHRAAINEVLLTSWETDGPDRFTVCAQWPRSHALFAPRFGHQDPTLIAETVRQIGALLGHTEYGVPLGHQFLMWDMSYQAAPGALAAGPAPTDLTLQVVCEIARRGKQLSAMRYRASLWDGATRIATAAAGYNCLSPAVYRRVRGDRPLSVHASLPPLPDPVDPATVGRRDAEHVVLGDPGAAGRDEAGADSGVHRWLLRADTAHPTLFDHPLDHVPGMVLLEAARQAAQAVLHPEPVLAVGLSSSFAHYAELDAPCWIEARPGTRDAEGATPVHVTGTQGGKELFTATVAAHPLT